MLDDILRPLGSQISMSAVAIVAGLHPNHLYNIRAGRRPATAATLSRLRFAVARIRTRQVEASLEVTACYRMALALAAVALGLDPALVQVSDPAAKQSEVPAWRAAANARRLAQYVVNTGLGFRQVDVARAAGVTKQAVNQAVAEIEDQRDDPAFDATVRRVEAWVLGGEA